MPSFWFMTLYIIIKSNFWKKFFLYLSFIFLLATSLPIVSTYLGIFFYSDDNRISNQNKKPAYVLVPTAGIWNDGFDKWHPTYVSIKRVKYGNELSKKFSVPLIIAGAGTTIVKEADFLSNFFDYDFYIVGGYIKLSESLCYMVRIYIYIYIYLFILSENRSNI